jgi:hypothetical protein
MLAFLHQGLCPGPLFRPPEQRACDADRDTAVDILCAAAAPGDRWAVFRSLLPSNADSMSGNPSCRSAARS